MRAELKRCIHGRSERQKCMLCNLSSRCCDAPVLKVNLDIGVYRCEACGKKCDAMRRS